MIKLRRFYTPGQLAEIYGHRYDPHRWPEHTVRIAHTIGVAQTLINDHGLKTAADLSAGDCSIPSKLLGLEMLETSDGHIESEILTLSPVDLFICTETIEHLEAPWTVLERIAERARFLVLTTPLDEDPAIGNYEHYWSFTHADVLSMLAQSGFVDREYDTLGAEGWTYSYQIWTARSEAYVAA